LIGKPLGLGTSGGKKVSVPIPGIKSGYRSSAAVGASKVKPVIVVADDGALPRPISKI